MQIPYLSLHFTYKIESSDKFHFEAHLLERGQIYLDVWKIGVNTALRISDLLALSMKDVKNLDPKNPALRLTEQKTGKPRKIVINKPALHVIQRWLNDHPKHVLNKG